jgi:hypothetical protein
MTNLTLFSQIIKSLNKQSFKDLVIGYQTDKYNKGLTSWTHLVTMLFLHFSGCNSLREICNGLKSAAGNLIHLGVLQSPSKSSLSYINQNRTWELFRDYYFKLLDYFSNEAGFKQKKFRIKRKIYLIDSTIVSLCLSLFDWALYRTAKGGIKLHTVLDFDSCLPVYVHVTDAKTHDSKVAEEMPLTKGAVAVVDRAYLNFLLLYKWTLAGVFFVTRLKSNIKYNKLEERELPDNKAHQILIDEYIELSEEKTNEKYPKKLRRVVVYNPEKNQSIELLTNNFTWTAETISELYKSRWQIEIFFKEIKQLLNIKSFVGTSTNAVMIQIWTAMITILILKYLKHKANYNWNLSNLVSYLRLNIFVKLELIKVLNSPFKDVVSDIKEMHPELEFY